MITKYTYFILENKGFNDIFDIYSNILYNLFKNFGYTTIDHDFTNNDFKIKNCKITFTNNKNSSFYTKNSYYNFDTKEILGYNFIFSIKPTEKETKSEFIHELVHAFEFYQISKRNKPIPFYNILKKSLLNTKISDEHPFQAFRHFIYLSLDNELNARIAQVYPFLSSLQTDNYSIILKELLKTDIYKKYNEMINFDSEQLCEYLIKNVGLINVCELVNKLNSEILSQVKINKYNLLKTYDFLSKKVDNDNLIDYFYQWQKIMKDKGKKHKNKLIQLIDKVIIDYRNKQNYIA